MINIDPALQHCVGNAKSPGCGSSLKYVGYSNVNGYTSSVFLCTNPYCRLTTPGHTKFHLYDSNSGEYTCTSLGVVNLVVIYDRD